MSSSPPAYAPVPDRDVELGDACTVTLLHGANPKRTLTVPRGTTVAQLKAMAFPEESATHRVRFIHCGKLLDNDDEVLERCGLDRSPFLHVAISNKAAGGPAPVETTTVVDDDETMEEADRRLAILLSERDDAVIEMDEYDPHMLVSREGDHSDFIWGFIFGSCLGYISVIWLWQPNVPRRQKLGILSGILVFLLMGAVRSPVPQSHT
ncbi:Ubiquitin-like domain-containing protein [Plasmodiophora brassicae]|uniref:Ubiquitin-like domain-containing protein n=1 Tax=Plasmodiophora brassicae TaxID=37360 RepID=A0A0G4IWB8_PLABS|nr:hypothetical protein PBRA_007285 [Plasmodiophora brassicae]